MVFCRFVTLSLLAIQVSADAQVETCSDGECMNNEESSLLAVKAPKFNLTKWFGGWGVNMCFNRNLHAFPCGDGQCCGDVCKAKGDLCCRNDVGYYFPCGKGGSCCGNACAAKGSKCCNKGLFKKGYEYPVSKGTKCADAPVKCKNSQGNTFQCGAGSSCCGDICVGPNSTCCHSMKHTFVCGPGSGCCGNSCVAPGSKCCRVKGLDYPVTKATKCAGWFSGSVPCTNRQNQEFLCAAHNTCCGNICAGPGSSCCRNAQGADFVCAPGTRCGKNVCVAR